MGNTAKALESYRKFLESIPLEHYRVMLKDVKWVEQDLPSEILPLGSIFHYYWHQQDFLDFDSWFEQFWDELHTNPTSFVVLRDFKKYYFDKDDDGWFKLGFRARMYRTWVSVLTQLDFCYAFLYACERQNKRLTLEANAELDAKGVNLRIGQLDFQVAKITQRKEARPSAAERKKIAIPYAVYNLDEYMRLSLSSRVSPENRIKYRRSMQAFHKYFISLKNGFVVFGENYVNRIVENLDEPARLRAGINQILLELSGATVIEQYLSEAYEYKF